MYLNLHFLTYKIVINFVREKNENTSNLACERMKQSGRNIQVLSKALFCKGVRGPKYVKETVRFPSDE